MTLKEEFEEQAEHLIDNEYLRTAIWSWIEQQIKSACDKQKEICEQKLRKMNYLTLARIVKQCPYPEGVEHNSKKTYLHNGMIVTEEFIPPQEGVKK